MLVKNDIDGAAGVVQTGLYEDPQHTKLNALKVSMHFLDLEHETQLTVCT